MKIQHKIRIFNKDIAIPGAILALIGTSSVSILVFALFGDVIFNTGNTTAGNLHIAANLKINNLSGDLAANPTPTTTTENDPRCDNLNCHGQNHGTVATKIQPNIINDFSYTLTNSSTVDYTNYTGDRIYGWLDYEWVPVEYLQFNGTNYINTNFKPTTNTQIEAQFSFGQNDMGNWSTVFGAQNTNLLQLNKSSGNDFQVSIGTTVGGPAAVANRIYNVILNNGSYTLDGVTHAVNPSGVTVDAPIFIGTKSTSGGTNYESGPAMFDGKIYSLKISENGQPIRNLIATRNIKTGECALWDQVSQQVFLDSGSGALTCPDPADSANANFVSLLPNGVGIDFDGSQYINTNILTSDRLTATADAAQPGLNLSALLGGTKYLFGANAGTNSNFSVSQSVSIFLVSTWNAQLGTNTSVTGLAGLGGLDLLSSAATFALSATASGGALSVDGTSRGTVTNADIMPNPRAIYLGARNNNGSVDGNFIGTFYGFSLSNNSTNSALANYQPAAQCNPATNSLAYGFWDSVSQKFIMQTAGDNFSPSVAQTYQTACAQAITPETNPMKILVYAASTSDSIINAEVAAMLAGTAQSSPSTLITVDENCAASFAGTDTGIAPVCESDILTKSETGAENTLGAQTAVDANKTYTFKFVVLTPTNTSEIFSDTKVHFGVSSAAHGTLAINWREQIHAYVAASTTLHVGPAIRVTGNTEPLFNQIANTPTAIDSYLRSIVASSDTLDGSCAFSGTTCILSIASDGGFDPSVVGIYNITYKVINSKGYENTVTIPIEVWRFQKIINGQYHTLAMGSNGSVWTFGYDSAGQRGYGDQYPTSPDAPPASIPPVQITPSLLGNTHIVDIAAGYATSYALDENGQVYAWGDATNYALGNGTITNTTIPVPVTMPTGMKFKQISSFHQAVAALGNDGNIYTWGEETYGSTGTGSPYQNQPMPRAITTTGNFTQVSMGYYGGAAVTIDGKVWVWGTDLEGEMGSNKTTCNGGSYQCPPAEVPNLNNIKKVAYGDRHVIALANNGTVYTWGDNPSGQLGQGDTSDRNVPTLVPGLTGITDIVAAYGRSYFQQGSSLYSTGNNPYGELFNGNTNNQYSPVIATVIGVAGNVGIIAGRYNNSFFLSLDGKTVYGIGWSETLGSEFGNPDHISTSSNAIVPWAFTPKPVP